MRHISVGFACLIASITVAHADNLAWTSFTDPTEQAFTLEVPQGWQVKGGITRVAPLVPKAWVAAASPDGASDIFSGDPSVPLFIQPNPKMFQPEGKQGNGMFGPTFATAYQNAAQFGANYGQENLPPDCTDVRVTGGKPRTDLIEISQQRAREIMGNQSPPGQSLDSAEVDFTCTVAGQPYRAAVMVVISRLNSPQGGGNWTAAVLYGFRAPESRAAEAWQAAEHLFTSFQPNRQWAANVRDAMFKQTQASIQQIQETGRQMQQNSDNAMRLQQQNFNQQMQMQQQQHQNYMDQQNQNAANRNQQFQLDQMQKTLNNQAEIRSIRGTHLVRDPTTGQLYEVPD